MSEDGVVRLVVEAALAARQAEDALIEFMASSNASVGSMKRLPPVLLATSSARGALEAAVKFHVAAPR